MAFCTFKVYNVWVGSEAGFLRGINLETKSHWNLDERDYLTFDQGFSVMCWANQEQTKVCAGRKNQVVQIYDLQRHERMATHDFSGGKGPFRGLCQYDGGFITCSESGVLRVWKENGEQRLEVHAGENICRMRQNPHQRHLVATGGKENDLKVWDLTNPALPVFEAKNAKSDRFSLRVPVWVTDMAFSPDGQQIVTCTGHRQVNVYDLRTTQRCPVLDMEFDKYPLTAMALRPGLRQVIVGNALGNMVLLDMRGKGHKVHRYEDCVGAIRCIECHPWADIVACCGFDCYLRVYNVTKRHLLHEEEVCLENPLRRNLVRSRLECLLLTSQW